MVVVQFPYCFYSNIVNNPAECVLRFMGLSLSMNMSVKGYIGKAKGLLLKLDLWGGNVAKISRFIGCQLWLRMSLCQRLHLGESY